MRILVDTNILLDILLKRNDFFNDSYSSLEFATNGKADVLIPASCIADVYYVVRRSGHDAKTACNSIRTLYQLFKVCDTAAADIFLALHLDMADLEDAILAATAKREKADYILTRDKNGFSGSPVPAITPRAFLQSFKS